MHTLAQLKSGELSQIRRLQLTENLTEFPVEIFNLADTLEILDLSNNQLSSLPSDFGRLYRLKILFLTNNHFSQIPQVIADCIHLNTISFKANRISSIAEAVFPVATRWLILTDNQINKLPDCIGELAGLQKLMLAGNKLTELPATLAQCSRLQLLRISANQLTCLPDWLLQMPELAWLAFAGNPFSDSPNSTTSSAQKVSLSDIQLHEQLGEGASGVIYRAKWIKQPLPLQDAEQPIAVKLFKGHVTSDGYPADELQASLIAGSHPNLVQITGHIAEENQLALIMSLIPSTFYNLGLPPSLETCTRDTFAKGLQLTLANIGAIALSIADTMIHLHKKGLCHGDLYAHNILIDQDASVLLGDFGAATHFLSLPDEQIAAIQAFEVRAYGHLLDDLLRLCSDKTKDPHLFRQLSELKNSCSQVDITATPTFTEIIQQLRSFN